MEKKPQIKLYVFNSNVVQAINGVESWVEINLTLQHHLVFQTPSKARNGWPGWYKWISSLISRFKAAVQIRTWHTIHIFLSPFFLLLSIFGRRSLFQKTSGRILYAFPKLEFSHHFRSYTPKKQSRMWGKIQGKFRSFFLCVNVLLIPPAGFALLSRDEYGFELKYKLHAASTKKIML